MRPVSVTAVPSGRSRAHWRTRSPIGTAAASAGDSAATRSPGGAASAARPADLGPTARGRRPGAPSIDMSSPIAPISSRKLRVGDAVGVGVGQRALAVGPRGGHRQRHEHPVVVEGGQVRPARLRDAVHDQPVALLLQVSAHPVELQHRRDPVGLLQPYVGDVVSSGLAVGERGQHGSTGSMSGTPGSRPRPRAARSRRAAPAPARPGARGPSAGPSRRTTSNRSASGWSGSAAVSADSPRNETSEGWSAVAARPNAAEPMSGGSAIVGRPGLWPGSISKRRQSSLTSTRRPNCGIISDRQVDVGRSLRSPSTSIVRPVRTGRESSPEIHCESVPAIETRPPRGRFGWTEIGGQPSGEDELDTQPGERVAAAGRPDGAGSTSARRS